MSAGPLIPLRQNPICPAWRYPSFEFETAALRYVKDRTFTVPTTGSFGLELNIDQDSDLLINEISFGVDAADPGEIQARLTNDGKRLSRDLLMVEEISGPLFTPMFCRQGAKVMIDLTNASGDSQDVQVQLKGWRQYGPLGAGQCAPGFEPESYLPIWKRYSSPPAGWHDEPYDYYFELPILASATRNKIPLPLDNDAVFLMRGMCGFSDEADGAGYQRLLFWDPWGNPLAQSLDLQGNVLGTENNLKTLFPEVLCPAGSVLQVDQAEILGAATTARVVLRGVKRFQD